MGSRMVWTPFKWMVNAERGPWRGDLATCRPGGADRGKAALCQHAPDAVLNCLQGIAADARRPPGPMRGGSRTGRSPASRARSSRHDHQTGTVRLQPFARAEMRHLWHSRPHQGAHQFGAVAAEHDDPLFVPERAEPVDQLGPRVRRSQRKVGHARLGVTAAWAWDSMGDCSWQMQCANRNRRVSWRAGISARGHIIAIGVVVGRDRIGVGDLDFVEPRGGPRSVMASLNVR